MTAALVVMGAIIGAPLRYLVDRTVQSWHRTVFPWGTITVNLIACAGLGLLTGAASAGVTSHQLQALLATGLCATLSTYSTFSYETLRLTEQRRPLYGLGTSPSALSRASVRRPWATPLRTRYRPSQNSQRDAASSPAHHLIGDQPCSEDTCCSYRSSS